MTTHNPGFYSTKIVVELIWEIVYFPIWWYTRGLWQFMLSILNFLSHKNKSIGFTVWLKNILRPMYGQYDFFGIIISIVIRSVQIIFRGLIMLIWIGLSLLALAAWLALPLIVAYQIMFQLSLIK